MATTNDLLYGTASQGGHIHLSDAPALFFLRRYFRATQTHEGKLVLWDKSESKPRIAPYVHPKHPGRPSEQAGYETVGFEPPYVQMDDELDPDEALRRLPGEVLLGALPANERYKLTAAIVRQRHQDKLDARKEVQCAELLRSGTVTVAGDGYETKVLDFERDPALTVVLSGASQWSAGGIKVLKAIDTYARLARRKGRYAISEWTMGLKAWESFLENLTEKETDLLTSVQHRTGDASIEMGPTAGEKVTYMGKIGAHKFWTYTDHYFDDDDNEHEVWNEWDVVGTGPGLMGTMAYAGIRNKHASFKALPIFQRMRPNAKDSADMISTESAPLAIPYNINSSIRITVGS